MKLLVLFLFLTMVNGTWAQETCIRTSVFFDKNKAVLFPESIKTIDSLLGKYSGSEFLVELYGYADSSASNDYNLKLSQSRINAVKAYISTQNSASYRFFEKNLGENDDKTNGNNLALSRRVDVFVFPISEGNITVGNAVESVEVPVDYFEPCGICNSKPKINSYYNEAAANAANMQLKTTDGLELITAGAFDFDFKPCEGSKASKANTLICTTIKSETIDPEMTVWDAEIIDGVVFWKPSEIQPVFDFTNKTYTFCSTGGPTNLDRLKNLDKPKKGFADLFILPSGFDTYKTEVCKKMDSSGVKSFNDSVFTPSNKKKYVTSFLTLQEKMYYLNRDFSSAKPFKIDTVVDRRNVMIVSNYKIDFSIYKEFEFTEEILKVKRTRNLQEVGFYIKEVKEFIPLEKNSSQNIIETPRPKNEFELAFMRKGKLYVLPYSKIKLKYKKRKGAYLYKLNK